VADNLADYGQRRWALAVYSQAVFFAGLGRTTKAWQSDFDEKAQNLSSIASGLADHAFAKLRSGARSRCV
jgi:hypothetical protein